MSMGKIEERIKKMKEAINTQAKQRALHIVERAEQEADLERVNIIRQQKQRINNEFEKLQKAQQVKAKIQKSSVINRQRIKKIEAMYKMVEQLKVDLKEKLKETTSNPEKYKEYVTKLIVQGLLRMMERNISVQALRDQREMLQHCFRQCEKKFSQIILKQTGREMSSTLTISEYSLEDKNKAILGGVFMRSHDGLIVCDNSLDARVELIFEQLLPEIRRFLFAKRY